jgi:hypothetical protein
LTINSRQLWDVIATAVQKVMRAHDQGVDLYRYSDGEMHRFEEIGPGVGLWRDSREAIVALQIEGQTEFPGSSTASKGDDVAAPEPRPGERVHEPKTGFIYEVVGVGTAFETRDRIVIYRYGGGHLFSCGLNRWLEGMQSGAMRPTS